MDSAGGPRPLCLFSKPVSTTHFSKYSRNQLVGFTFRETFDTGGSASPEATCHALKSTLSHSLPSAPHCISIALNCIPACSCVRPRLLTPCLTINQEATRPWACQPPYIILEPSWPWASCPMLTQALCDHTHAVWEVVTPEPAQRAISVGLEVLAGAPIQLIHCATQKPLLAETQKYPNDFGMELELSARTSGSKVGGWWSRCMFMCGV